MDIKIKEMCAIISCCIATVGMVIGIYKLICHFLGIKLVQIVKTYPNLLISVHNKNSRFEINIHKITIRLIKKLFKKQITNFEGGKICIAPRKTEDILIPFYQDKKRIIIVKIEYEKRGQLIEKNYIRIIKNNY